MPVNYYCIRGIYTFIFAAVFSNSVNAQEVKPTYNTKINRAHVVYIKNAGGNTYITKADSVIISQVINKSMQVRDTVKVDSTIPNENFLGQGVFIVDPLPVTAFKHDIEGVFKGYHFVEFRSLTTTSGKDLPNFQIPPTILIFSSSNSPLKLGNIKADGFYISTEDKTGDRFTAWISEKTKGVHFKPIANAGDYQIIYLRQ